MPSRCPTQCQKTLKDDSVDDNRHEQHFTYILTYIHNKFVTRTKCLSIGRIGGNVNVNQKMFNVAKIAYAIA